MPGRAETRPGVPLQLPEGGGRGLPVALSGGVVVGVLLPLPVLVLLPLVPEPVAGSVLVLLRVPVSLPVVEPVIELSLPLPPVEGAAAAPVAPVVELVP